MYFVHEEIVEYARVTTSKYHKPQDTAAVQPAIQRSRCIIIVTREEQNVLISSASRTHHVHTSYYVVWCETP